MSVSLSDDDLDHLLAEALGPPPPPLDFGKWQQRYPDAVKALGSGTRRPAGVAAVIPAGAGSAIAEVPDRELLERYRDGDEAAAAALFNRYYRRLSGLAREMMGAVLRETGESADLAQSVFESVFLRGRACQIEIGPAESLWPLLVTITLNKLRNRARYWGRRRRDWRRQVSLEAHDPLETGPTPEDVAELHDLKEKLLGAFSERRRAIVECLLDGLSVADTARKLGACKRTIYRTREAAMRILKQMLEES